MRILMATSRPTYKRRLVREVNRALSAKKPVYAYGHRIEAVKYDRLMNEIFFYSTLADNQSRTAGNFFDHNGQEICASREK